MTPLENNATVVGLTKLPDCLFKIQIRPDWNTENIPWSPGQFVRIGILDDEHNQNIACNDHSVPRRRHF